MRRAAGRARQVEALHRPPGRILRQVEDGIAGERLERQDDVPARQHVVAAQELGKHLLINHAPQLPAVGLGEDGLPGGAVAREEIVHRDLAPSLLQRVVQPHRVPPAVLVLFGDKEVADGALVL